MAELATIARPYAEALMAAGADANTVAQLQSVAQVAADAELLQFASHPKVSAQQVYGLIVDASGQTLVPAVQNLLQAVIENGRLVALPEIAQQAQVLLNARSGVSQAQVTSAFPIDATQLAQVKQALEQRFGRRLDVSVDIDESLIGGIRAVVGDEVLDTSVKARLERMKLALTA
ncbi:MAG: F0F1 ATP synthase subunit delta [Rubrivivax sp.]|jgi:F-type H+-transporting ATPase subunit delta